MLGDVADLVRGLVDEHPDDRRAHIEGVHDRLRLLRRDPPRAVAEVEAEHVGPRLGGHGGRAGVADAADLDPDQTVSSLTRADGSGDRINASPTRIASAPASRIRRASAAEWMPL